MVFKAKKSIRNYARYAFFVVFLILPIIFLCFPPKFTGGPDDYLPYAIMCAVFLLAGLGLLHFTYLEAFFAYLVVTDEEIVWKCPFRKTRRIAVDKCKYIGIDTSLPGDDSIERFPILYFSTKPYPEKYKGKIAKIKCSDTFIKFWYLDALADYLLEYFPREKTYLVAGFKRRQKYPFN